MVASFRANIILIVLEILVKIPDLKGFSLKLYLKQVRQYIEKYRHLNKIKVEYIDLTN